MLRSLVPVFFLAAATSSPLHGQDAGFEFFERKIRPVLVERCYECHSAAAKKVRGGLLLDSRPAWQEGGDTGPALIPGHPEKSLLIKALRFSDDSLKMPPKGKLSPAIIADFEAWVKMGAPDPRDKPTSTKVAGAWEEILRKRRDWWSLKPVQLPAIPRVKDAAWSPHDIDHFLLAKLEEKGLTPAPFADSHTLARRLSLVLTGLPPTPEQVEAFVRDCKSATPGRLLPTAPVEKLVDTLLASPHFGERWARHWMDLVRFTETHGNEWNYEVHHAWRYRDYLVRAFNDDIPFDQFIREHIAGDLLAKPRWNPKEAFNESIIGTAFYRFGEVNHDDCISLPQIGYDLVDNQIDTLSKTFQAMTVACARCHDHKLDAVSMRDYYGLLGVLRSSRQVSHTIDSPEVNADLQRKMRDKKRELRRALAETWRQQVPQIVRHLPIAADTSKEPRPAKEVDPDLLARWRTVLNEKDPPLESPLTLASLLHHHQKQSLPFADAWKKTHARITEEAARRRAFNEQFTTLADFRAGPTRFAVSRSSWEPDWQVGGHGLRGQPSPPGDFIVASEGDNVITSILPAGAYTDALSAKLNGTLRSPILTTDKKWISFRVRGEHSSAVRLVSNNCQLNYKNYRALTSKDFAWITIPLPEDRAALRVYAELMTKFDNPKFPDQLGTLGGDKLNHRVPWEKAAADPRSYFGVTHVVVHDQPKPPQPDLGAALLAYADEPPTSFADVATRFSRQLTSSIDAWQDDTATDVDALWLDTFLRQGLLANTSKDAPKLATLLEEYRALETQLALPRIVPGLADCGPGFEQTLFVRGDCARPGDTTPRRFVEVLAATQFPASGSGRLELANAIAARSNPLTARVFVNRVWHHLFGAGIVRTVDDFGHVGDLPSHPELLDHLATRFMDEGWSIKRLIRSIVLTHAFQLSHRPSPAALEADPENRLLQRYPARRMEAEAIRDSLLAASGRLDRTLFGPSIASYREKEYADRRLFRGPLDGNGRRSIYIRATLMEAPRFLDVFNFPGGKVAQGRRDVTHVPAQALALLNDPFVLQQADVWSKRAIERRDDTIAARIDAMFRTALGRAPNPSELDRFKDFVSQAAELNGVSMKDVPTSPAVWRAVAHTLFNVQEFITIP